MFPINGPSSGLSQALQGMQRHMKAFDRAAEHIADATLGEPDVSTAAVASVQAPSAASESETPMGDSLTDGFVNIILAQRLFSAQVRVAETADAITAEAVRLGDRG